MLENLRSRFEQDGFIGPFRGVDLDTVARFEQDFVSDRLPQRRNTHLVVPSAAAICRSAEIMSVCAELLGPDIAIWRSAVFAGSPDLTLHRDVYADNLAGADAIAKQLSVHIAVTASRPQNCLVLIPGSHRLSSRQLQDQVGLTEVMPHISGNTRFAGGGDDAVHHLAMQPGEVVVFHPLCVHGSSTKTVRPPEPMAAGSPHELDSSTSAGARAGIKQPKQEQVHDRLAFVLRLMAPELQASEAGRWPLKKLLRRRTACTMLSGEPGDSKNRFRPLASS